jgi:hypothetical protein
VQGERTVGITEEPELAPLKRLAERLFPPRDLGVNTIEVCDAMQTRQSQLHHPVHARDQHRYADRAT